MTDLSVFRALFAWQTWAVFWRHVRVYGRTWKTGILPPVFEPLVFFVAFGVGLREYVTGLTWEGVALSYTAYVAPALVAYSAFTTSFYESLYSSYVRMFYQRTWDGMLATQIELPHIWWAEALFAGARGAANSSIVMLVLVALGLCGVLPELSLAWLWLVPAFAWLAGVSFAAFGLLFTVTVPGIQHMNYPVFMVGVPLGLFSETYFPIPETPRLLRILSDINPVACFARLMRHMLLAGDPVAHMLPALLSTLALLLLCAPVGLKLMRRRVLEQADP